MRLKLTLLLIGVCTAAMATCDAQTGTVTFYSATFTVANQLKAGVVPAGRVPFAGWLFDGNQRLAHAKPGRFFTFRLPAGPHTFSATYKSAHPGSSTLQLNVEPDQHYCVNLSVRYLNYVVVPLSTVDSKLRALNCEEASQEASQSKPLELKRIDSQATDKLVLAAAFPSP
jgi:hypothetical protein